MGEIVIHDSKLMGQKLTSRVAPPKDLRKYFKTFTFFAHYDTDIDADRSILNIPLLAAVLPLAWLTGSDIYVEELDRAFKESMDELKQVFTKMLPKAPFTTTINAGGLVTNQIGKINPTERTGLLFSGGVDSTYSLITNLQLNPHLIMFWGTDDYPYPENRIQWEKIIPTYRDFAGRRGLRFSTVKTNISIIQDETRISHDFHKFMYNGTFRMRLLHSFVLLPLAAPLSIGRFDRLLVAASGRTMSLEEERKLGHPPSPMRPETDEKIVWADLKVTYDGGIGRRPKIRGAIKDYLEKDALKLKTCLRRLERAKLNDNTCVKCVNCILLLSLEGIDPNRCGFEVDDSTWDRFKHYFEEELIQDTAVSAQFFSELQASIPDHLEHDFYGSRAFLQWFKDFDLASKEKNVRVYRDLYYRLPYSIARILDKCYMLMGIRIHDQNPPLRQNALI